MKAIKSEKQPKVEMNADELKAVSGGVSAKDILHTAKTPNITAPKVFPGGILHW
jgi:hypothetical protein